MGKRRGEVEEVVRRVLALKDKYRGYSLLVIDRSRAGGTKRIPVDCITGVERGFLVLEDGTLIPFHRVLALVDSQGARVWERRSGGKSTGPAA